MSEDWLKKYRDSAHRARQKKQGSPRGVFERLWEIVCHECGGDPLHTADCPRSRSEPCPECTATRGHYASCTHHPESGQESATAKADPATPSLRVHMRGDVPDDGEVL